MTNMQDITTTNPQTTRPYPFFRPIPDQSDYDSTVDNSDYGGIGDISQEPLLDYLNYQPAIFCSEHKFLSECRFEYSSPEPLVENSNAEISIDQPEHDPVAENPDHEGIISISKEPLINRSAHNVVISRPSLWCRRIAESSDYDDIFDNSYYQSIGGLSEEPLLGHPDYDNIVDNSHNFDNCEDEPVVHSRNFFD
ncbi:hypothetical protein MMC14_006689 [Varicellaria rhodocarpa]|nr:hypothetical protein [Varicellaria rhodocarpa]